MNSAPSRSQLTLFVPAAESTTVEAVRRLLDPVQARLIRAHVTLCREDEIEGLVPAEIEARVRTLKSGTLRLRFGPPTRFHEHGVLLPCVEGQQDFDALRRCVLSRAVRPHAAHVTLAHPRNHKAEGNTPQNAAILAQGVGFTFPAISFIRQRGNEAWERLSEHHFPVMPCQTP